MPRLEEKPRCLSNQLRSNTTARCTKAYLTLLAVKWCLPSDRSIGLHVALGNRQLSNGARTKERNRSGDDKFAFFFVCTKEITNQSSQPGLTFLIFSPCTVRKWPIGYSVSLVFGIRYFNLNFTASKNKSYSEASGRIYTANLSSARKSVYLHQKRIEMTKKQTNKPQGSPTYEKTCIYVPACVPCFGQFAPERFSFQPGSERTDVVRQKPYRQQTIMYTFTTSTENNSIKIGKAFTGMTFS